MRRRNGSAAVERCSARCWRRSTSRAATAFTSCSSTPPRRIKGSIDPTNGLSIWRCCGRGGALAPPRPRAADAGPRYQLRRHRISAALPQYSRACFVWPPLPRRALPSDEAAARQSGRSPMETPRRAGCRPFRVADEFVDMRTQAPHVVAVPVFPHRHVERRRIGNRPWTRPLGLRCQTRSGQSRLLSPARTEPPRCYPEGIVAFPFRQVRDTMPFDNPVK